MAPFYVLNANIRGESSESEGEGVPYGQYYDDDGSSSDSEDSWGDRPIVSPRQRLRPQWSESESGGSNYGRESPLIRFLTDFTYHFEQDEFWVCPGCHGYWLAYRHPYTKRQRWYKRALARTAEMVGEGCQNCPGWTYSIPNSETPPICEGVWYPQTSLIKMEYVGSVRVWSAEKQIWQFLLRGQEDRPPFDPSEPGCQGGRWPLGTQGYYRAPQGAPAPQAPQQQHPPPPASQANILPRLMCGFCPGHEDEQGEGRVANIYMLSVIRDGSDSESGEDFPVSPRSNPGSATPMIEAGPYIPEIEAPPMGGEGALVSTFDFGSPSHHSPEFPEGDNALSAIYNAPREPIPSEISYGLDAAQAGFQITGSMPYTPEAPGHPQAYEFASPQWAGYQGYQTPIPLALEGPPPPYSPGEYGTPGPYPLFDEHGQEIQIPYNIFYQASQNPEFQALMPPAPPGYGLTREEVRGQDTQAYPPQTFPVYLQTDSPAQLQEPPRKMTCRDPPGSGMEVENRPDPQGEGYTPSGWTREDLAKHEPLRLYFQTPPQVGAHRRLRNNQLPPRTLFFFPFSSYHCHEF